MMRTRAHQAQLPRASQTPLCAKPCRLPCFGARAPAVAVGEEPHTSALSSTSLHETALARATLAWGSLPKSNFFLLLDGSYKRPPSKL